MREGDAGQHPRRGQVEPGRLLHLLSCVILVCSAEIAALTDFAGYLTKLLQNHTAYACDGEHLSLHCPRHSTISVQSAFYGQDYQMCSTLQPETRMTEPINCVAPTSLQKVLDECQNLRSCQLLVNSRVFGPDLCPGTTKFLLVSFKCKPTEYKTKSACENQELKLHCQESKFLIIYSATFGRSAHEENICSTEMERIPPFDCLSYTALKVLSKRCYGKQRCKIIVTSQDFGSPCLPGVKKYLNVSYACVPKFILTAVDPLLTDSKPSVKQNDAGRAADGEQAGILQSQQGCKMKDLSGRAVRATWQESPIVDRRPGKPALILSSGSNDGRICWRTDCRTSPVPVPGEERSPLQQALEELPRDTCHHGHSWEGRYCSAQ
ncbi:protein eva-1 homolog C isoform X5 [Rhea pennata]|uniref:protein eva-1 homolog C isoform X5 n=1 Tax=Rhea pennata TaxID=8795 RepID=UPI002E25BB84